MGIGDWGLGIGDWAVLIDSGLSTNHPDLEYDYPEKTAIYRRLMNKTDIQKTDRY